jgi:hypothetical protein
MTDLEWTYSGLEDLREQIVKRVLVGDDSIVFECENGNND